MALDTRSPECRESRLDPFCTVVMMVVRLIDLIMGMMVVSTTLVMTMIVIEPSTVIIALEAVDLAKPGDLNHAEFGWRQRQQHGRLSPVMIVAMTYKIGAEERRAFGNNNANDQSAEEQPDSDLPRSDAGGTHRCRHQTATPIMASNAGKNMTDKTKVALIWRLVTLKRGRS